MRKKKIRVMRWIVSTKNRYNSITDSLVYAVTKRMSFGFFVSSGAVKTGNELYHIGHNIPIVILYGLMISVILSQILLPKNYKEEHSKLFFRLRLLNIGIVGLIALSEYLNTGQLEVTGWVSFILEIGLELMHKLMLH